jgi:hypothetical protein
VETCKLSTDPSFESKLRDLVGLYVNPPAARRSRTGRDVLAFFRWIDMRVDPTRGQATLERIRKSARHH